VIHSQKEQRRTLEAGMWLIGTAYNFCCWHRSLRLSGDGGAGEQRWIERTPAQAAGLTFSKVGRFMSCLSLPSLRLHPSGAGDDRDGCWRLLMLLDCSSTVEWGTTDTLQMHRNCPYLQSPGRDKVVALSYVRTGGRRGASYIRSR
jgi:hypothetical protein